MSSNLASSTSLPTPHEEPISERSSAFDGAFVRDASAATLFSSWPAPVPAPSTRVRELCAVLALSTFFHAGVAIAAMGNEPARPSPKRLSRVEVELARPERPKPAARPVVPPPPPKVVKHDKPLAAPLPSPIESPVTPPPLDAPVDTGSSAPAAEDGELFAGNGGLGAAPPPPPAPPAPVKAVEPVIQAREGANYAKNPRPSYPRQAKRQGLEGTALLRVQVQASGKPGAIKIQKSSGHELLDEAALQAVATWTFVPSTQGGEPVAGSVLVPIVFRLQQ